MLSRYLIIAACLASVTAQAQETTGSGIAFEFGVGSAFEPDYFGDDNRRLRAAVNARLERFQIRGFEIGGEETLGFGFEPSFNAIPGRSADDFSELSGLDDVDFSLEMGGGFAFRAPGYDVFAALRYGVIGHGGWVADVGADLVLRPQPAVVVRVGPRLQLADDRYVDTYFGVTGSESAASQFSAFDPDGGLTRIGAEAEAIYSHNDNWSVITQITYSGLQGDAADSPIVRDTNQLAAGIYLSRRFVLGF